MTLKKLSYNGACIEKEDIYGEFWRGVANGMSIVNPKIGDPISYLIQRGVWQVRSVVRTELGKKMVQTCLACLHVNTAYALDRKCERCGQDAENQNRFAPIDETDIEDTYVSTVSTVTLHVRPSDQQLRVLELLIQCCVDGSENPQADVARALGVSRQRIGQHLEKLRPYLHLTAD